jgi:Amt family ammonium transporter
MWEPIVIGAVGGVLVAYAVPFFDKLRIDDPVGALSVHLVNGIWGTIAVALFNSEYSMMDQLKGIVVVALFTFSLSFALFYAIKKLLGLRSDEEHEYEGLDFEECGVESYPEFVKSKT